MHRIRRSLVQWSEEKENKFNKTRSESRNMFHGIAKTSNYIDCGFSDHIQAVFDDNQVKNFRVRLFEFNHNLRKNFWLKLWMDSILQKNSIVI